MNENSSTGTHIGTLSTTDPNPGDTHTYSLIKNPGNAVQIQNGNELQVNNASVFDHATPPELLFGYPNIPELDGEDNDFLADLHGIEDDLNKEAPAHGCP